MRVTQTGSSPVQNSEVSGSKQTSRTGGARDAKKADKGQAGATGGTEGANATISPRAREMAGAKEIASAAPDVREEKIAELKRRIASGSYHVDADAVADRMVDDHIKMSGIG